MRLPLSLLALAMASLFPTAALAQDATAETAWEFGGSVAATSDYVWRGVSQTQGKPALQIDLNATHASGFYAGVWASNVDFGDPDDGIDVEINPYIGWSGAVSENTELDLILTHVAFPGYNPGYNYDYTELEAKLSFAGGLYVGAAYSPDIFNLGGPGYYTNVGVQRPLGATGFDFVAQVGHYNLKQSAGDTYTDYLVGVGRKFGPVRADLAYTNTLDYSEVLSESLDDASQADGRAVLTLTWEF